MVSEPAEIVTNECVRTQILDAAESLFEQYGYRKTTIEEIAQEAKIGKGTVYLYFKSKEDLGLCWLQRLHNDLYKGLEKIAFGADPPNVKIQKLLMKRICHRFDVFTRHRRSMDEALSTLRDLIFDCREVFHRKEAGLIAQVIREGIANGEFHTGDPDLAAESMVLATNSLLPYSLSPQKLGDRPAVVSKAQNLIGLLVQAVEIRKG